MASTDSMAARDLVASALRGELSRRDLLSRSVSLGVSAPLVTGLLAIAGEDVQAADLQSTPGADATPSSAATPVTDTEDAAYEVSGLQGPAEILVDQWGVPHIYASSLYDAFLERVMDFAR